MQPTPNKSKLFLMWVLASAVAVSAAVLISSPITLSAIGQAIDLTTGDIPSDDPDAAIAAGDEADMVGLFCAPPLFLAMFCLVTALVQWGILRKHYRAGVAVFVGSFLLVMIITAVAIPTVRRLWFIAVLGAAWFGGVYGAGQLVAMTAMIGGISGAITGIIVMSKK